jgi:Asp-tRNA(Asn)/Glu-tRNA(Gln) amidotransferase A subunit family amidase
MRKANIKKDNLEGLGLRAVFQTAPYENVLAIAHVLDEERSHGHVRGELHGIPILVKCVFLARSSSGH